MDAPLIGVPPKGVVVEVERLLSPWQLGIKSSREPGSVILATNIGFIRCDVRRVTSSHASAFAVESIIARAAVWNVEETKPHGLIVIVAKLDHRLMEAISHAWLTIRKASLRLDALVVVSRARGIFVRLRESGSDMEHIDPEPNYAPVFPTSGGDPIQFTEANSQLLKALLYTELRERGEAVERWYRGPMGPFASAQAWGRACQLSRATTYRLQKILVEQGHLRDAGRLRLVGAERLLAQWITAAAGNAGGPYLPVCPVYRAKTKDPTEEQRLGWLGELAQDAEKKAGILAVNGWKALASHGLGIVIGSQPLTTVIPNTQQLQVLLDAGNIRFCPQDESWAFIRLAEDSRAVFAGVVRGDNNLPIVDVWQSVLDVASDPHRGREQAHSVAKRFAKILA